MSGYWFKFGGTYSYELGSIVDRTPSVEIAQRDFVMINIPGKNGSDCIDHGKYNNVSFTRNIALVQKGSSTVSYKINALINAFAYLKGYQEFEDSDHSALMTYAVLTNLGEVNRDLRRLGRATLRFSRQPFWYAKTGLTPIELDSESMMTGRTLRNMFPADAQPIYKFVLNSGKSNGNYFRLQVGDYIHLYDLGSLKYYIDGTTSRRYITFDCENKEIKAQSTEEGGNIAYAEMALPPDLKYGINTTVFKITQNYTNCLDVYEYNSALEVLVMIPLLFDSFDTVGTNDAQDYIGQISHCTKCLTKEDRNGEYYR